jgi:hypothetical protein
VDNEEAMKKMMIDQNTIQDTETDITLIDLIANTVNNSYRKKGMNFGKMAQNNGEPTSRNTFMPNNWKHTAAQIAEPLIFTGFATFGSWEIFGNSVLPFVKKQIEKHGLKVDSEVGQAIVGTALATQITTIFPVVGIAQNIYHNTIQKLGVPTNEKESNTVAQTIRAELQTKLNDFKSNEDISEIELETIKRFEQSLQNKTFWSKFKEQITNGGAINGKARNMFFQLLEDGTAASFEVAASFFGWGKHEVMNHIDSVSALVPETARDTANLFIGNKKSETYIGRHTEENNSFFSALKNEVTNTENYKGPLEFHAKRLPLIPLRGVMRGLHYGVAQGVMKYLKLNRLGDIFNVKDGITEIAYQASRNGMFQQLPWQMGKLGIDNLVDFFLNKCNAPEKEYYISDFEEKISRSKGNTAQGARLLEDGVDGKYITKESVLKSVDEFAKSIDNIKHYFNDDIFNNSNAKIFLSAQLIRYEEHWAERALTQSEKKAIKGDLTVRLNNFQTAIKNTTEQLEYLKLLTKYSTNPDKIRAYIACAKEVDNEIVERFKMLFPTGVVQDDFWNNIQYKRFTNCLTENNRVPTETASRLNIVCNENENTRRNSQIGVASNLRESTVSLYDNVLKKDGKSVPECWV